MLNLHFSPFNFEIIWFSIELCFIYSLILEFEIREKDSLENNKGERKRLVITIEFTKIAKFNVKAFILIREVSLNCFWIFLSLEKVDWCWKKFFFLLDLCFSYNKFRGFLSWEISFSRLGECFSCVLSQDMLEIKF